MSILPLIATFICQSLLSSNAAGVIAGQIRSSDGEPLAGISVMLATGEFRDGRATLLPGGLLIRGTVAQTDAAGRFRLDNIRPARYYILATPGSTSNGDVPTLYPGATGLDNAIRVEVGPRSEIAGIDFKISRTVLVNVSGRFFDATAGNTSRTATVNLTGGGLLGSFRTTVDANGSFQFKGVPPGDYVLWATQAGTADSPYTTRRITIPERDIDGIEVEFRPPVTVRGRIIFEEAGRLTNPMLVPGVTVNIVEALRRSGTTALIDGSFQFGEDLIEGEYWISVDNLPGDYYVKSMSFGSADLLQETLKVSALSPAELAITIAEGTRVQGKVVDQIQVPVPNACVYLVPRNSGAGQSHFARSVQTEQSGAFEFRGVVPGDYTLFAVPQFVIGSAEDPEFIRDYEGRGTMITASQDVHVALTLSVLQ